MIDTKNLNLSIDDVLLEEQLKLLAELVVMTPNKKENQLLIGILNLLEAIKDNIKPVK